MAAAHRVSGALLLLAGFPGVVPAQVGPSAPPPVDTTGLADGPSAVMEMLYERTIFNVDVLHLTLRFGPETATELHRIVEGGRFSDAVADSVARVALQTRDVLVRSQFRRDVDLEQFLDGLRDNLDNATDRNIVTPAERERILADVATQYEPLRDRGIREGEIMWYRIRGDSLHVAFQALDGSVLVDSRPVGDERRRSVLGGYFARGSDFREKLVRSLFTAR